MEPEEPRPISTFRLRRRTPGSFVLVPCPKIGRSLRCQGQLERAAAIVLAACPEITDVREQPLEIWYRWRNTDRKLRIQLLEESPQTRRINGDRVSWVVPDFLVWPRNLPPRLIEVKPRRKLGREDVQRKLAVARMFAERSGWTMHVLTERELFSGTLLSVLSLLARYRVISPNPALCEAIQERVPVTGITIGDLIRHTTRKPTQANSARIQLYHLPVWPRRIWRAASTWPAGVSPTT